ncbi:MAG TPA: site-2 protease family protein [Gemmatimonadales bacterium]
MPDLAGAAVYYVVFLFSTTLHEAAHAWAAKLGGDLTAYHGGQVSLNPLPHIRREPFGMVVLPVMSCLLSGWPFGFASAPYSREWAMRYPKRAGWMALAGPGANLLLVLIAAAGIKAGIASHVFFQPSSITFGKVAGAKAGGFWPGAAFMLGVFFSLNLLLALFNLLPLPPLDGSAAVPLLLSDEASTRYQEALWNNPSVRVVGMLVAWQVFNPVFQPVFTFSLNLLYPGSHYH